MYKVLDVCRYIINYSNEKRYGISNLKLQKLLYFVQAFFIITPPYGICFKESIEAWDFGPVVPEAYHEYKQYGSGNIPPIKSYFVFSDSYWVQEVPYNANIIAVDDQEKINQIIDMFSNYSATDLVRITHNQAPWKKAYAPNQNNIISIDSIKGYFKHE